MATNAKQTLSKLNETSSLAEHKELRCLLHNAIQALGTLSDGAA